MKGVEQGEDVELSSFERRINEGMSAEEAMEFFHGLIRETCSRIRRKRQAAKEDSQYIREVMQYVQENYQDPDLNVSITALHFEICPQAGFRNSGALIRVFKKETGITPGQMKKLNK